MNWLTISVLAQVVLGTSAVFDKILLGRRFFNPFTYTFWLGILGIFSALLLPFGFQTVSYQIIGVSFLAGVFFILAMFFLFYALNLGEASQTLPVIGGISPIFTLIFSYFLLNSWLGSGDLLAFSIIVLGSLVLFYTEKKELRKSFLFLVLLSSLFFGASNVLSKIVFEASNFITGFFWIKMGGILLTLFFLIFKRYRQEILTSNQRNLVRHYFLYLSNRA
jgi:drug/metabolite transporter (DMT)-like permease